MGDEIMAILRELNEQEKTTIVMVTHDPRLAEETDRTVRLFDGRQVN
jgi:putative ABC transport system ATP-binding protein